MEESINVLGGKLQSCSTDPMTGWFRDGCCNTDNSDFGRHVDFPPILLANFLMLKMRFSKKKLEEV